MKGFSRELWRQAAVGLVAGLVGGLVLGVGGRVAMRLVALGAGLDPGFSWGGTGEVVATGLFIGVPAAFVFIATRRFIPGPGVWRGAAFSALLFLVLVVVPPPAARSAAGAVGRPLLTLSLFGPLFLLYGIVVELVRQHAAAPAATTRTADERRCMIDGVGGAFIFSNDAERLANWYEDRLGLTLEKIGEGGAFYRVFWALDPENPSRRLDTTFSIMSAHVQLPRPGGDPEPDNMYGDQPFMVNLRVRDLDALIERLESKGVKTLKREDYDYGRFAWVRDLDGNRVELYEPAAGAQGG